MLDAAGGDAQAAIRHPLGCWGCRGALETFTEARESVQNARYAQDRLDALAALDSRSIDAPIVDIVAGLAALPHCFTLQSCYGHFVCSVDDSPRDLEPIAPGCRHAVTYRIAYLALCLEDSQRGRALQRALARVPEVAPGYIQFGSATGSGSVGSTPTSSRSSPSPTN